MLARKSRRGHTYGFCSPRRAAPHCMVVNLVRSGRKQPQLFSASAGGTARHPSSVRRSRINGASRPVRLALFALLACTGADAHALDGVAFEFGTGDGVKTARAALQWDWKSRWLQSANWHVGGYWDVALAYWKWNNGAPGLQEKLFDFGLTPVFRLQPNGLAGPYVEAGIGFHLLSHSSIGDNRLSTAFQFGSHVGVGYRFGARRSFEAGYRFQHISNAGIKDPNAGMNFHQVRAQYHF
jgi:lipid A 3-O-deacylase